MSRTTLLAAAFLLSATPVLAQDDLLGVPVEPEAPPCPCAWSDSASGWADRMPHRILRMHRPQLGVLLGEPTEVNGRTGVRVEEVREGSPAEQAGLRPGDILLSVDGRSLGDEPVREIREILADAEPGESVDVTFSREGREQSVAVTTREARFQFFGPEGARVRAVRAPGVEELRMRVPALRRLTQHAFHRGGIQLVAMNEGLGEYFGVSEGVLVAEVPEGSSLGLEAGDVLVAIDGRAVRDPGHAHSILGSYRPDETITLEVVRDRERLSVTGTRPEPSGPRIHR